jgi:hypothetical protein
MNELQLKNILTSVENSTEIKMAAMLKHYLENYFPNSMKSLKNWNTMLKDMEDEDFFLEGVVYHDFELTMLDIWNEFFNTEFDNDDDTDPESPNSFFNQVLDAQVTNETTEEIKDILWKKFKYMVSKLKG